MINIPKFKTDLFNIFQNRTIDNYNEFTESFINSYCENLVIPLTTVNLNSVTKYDNSGLKIAFNNAFEIMSKYQVPVDVSPYSIISLAFIDFWLTKVEFNSLPPVPPTISPLVIPPYTNLGVNITSCIDISVQLFAIFNSEFESYDSNISAENISNKLSVLFANQINTMGAVYCGLVPGTPPVPTILPITLI